MLILIILAWVAVGTLSVVKYYSNERKEDKLNAKIDSLTKHNIELSRKLDENVIGTGNLKIEIKVTEKNEMFFRFINNSVLPVYDAEIIIYNYSEIKKCKLLREVPEVVIISKECLKTNRYKLIDEIFNPGGGLIAENSKYKITNGYMNFEIIIRSRKRTISKRIVCKVVNKKIIFASRTYNIIDEKMEFITENDPLNLPGGFWEENFYDKMLAMPT